MIKFYKILFNLALVSSSSFVVSMDGNKHIGILTKSKISFTADLSPISIIDLSPRSRMSFKNNYKQLQAVPVSIAYVSTSASNHIPLQKIYI